jgi:hypothetical protein
MAAISDDNTWNFKENNTEHNVNSFNPRFEHTTSSAHIFLKNHCTLYDMKGIWTVAHIN